MWAAHWSSEQMPKLKSSVLTQPVVLSGVPGDRLELNAKLAAALSSPVLMALDAQTGRSATDMARSAAIAANVCREEHADVLGLVVNRVRGLQIAPWLACPPLKGTRPLAELSDHENAAHCCYRLGCAVENSTVESMPPERCLP